jgi:hypothetical protein
MSASFGEVKHFITVWTYRFGTTKNKLNKKISKNNKHTLTELNAQKVKKKTSFKDNILKAKFLLLSEIFLFETWYAIVDRNILAVNSEKMDPTTILVFRRKP